MILPSKKLDSWFTGNRWLFCIKTQQAETTKFESWNFWQPRELAVGRLGIFCSQNPHTLYPQKPCETLSEGCACFLCVEILFSIFLIWCEREMDCIFIFVWTFTSKVKDRIQKDSPTSRSSYFICIPIESMYCIFAIIYHIQPNVGTYIIHGSYGIDLTPLLLPEPTDTIPWGRRCAERSAKLVAWGPESVNVGGREGGVLIRTASAPNLTLLP